MAINPRLGTMARGAGVEALRLGRVAGTETLKAAKFVAKKTGEAKELGRKRLTKAGRLERQFEQDVEARVSGGKTKEQAQREVAKNFFDQYFDRVNQDKFINPQEHDDLLKVFAMFRNLFGKDFLKECAKKVMNTKVGIRTITVDYNRIDQRSQEAKKIYAELAKEELGQDMYVDEGRVKDSAELLERLTLRLNLLRVDLAGSTGDVKTAIERTPGAMEDIGLALLSAERMRRYLKEFKNDVVWKKKWEDYRRSAFETLKNTGKSRWVHSQEPGVIKNTSFIVDLLLRVGYVGSRGVFLGGRSLVRRGFRGIRSMRERPL